MRRLPADQREDLSQAEMAQVKQERQFCRSSNKDLVFHPSIPELCKIYIKQSCVQNVKNGGLHNRTCGYNKDQDECMSVYEDDVALISEITNFKTTRSSARRFAVRSCSLVL